MITWGERGKGGSSRHHLLRLSILADQTTILILLLYFDSFTVGLNGLQVRT